MALGQLFFEEVVFFPSDFVYTLLLFFFAIRFVNFFFVSCNGLLEFLFLRIIVLLYVRPFGCEGVQDLLIHVMLISEQIHLFGIFIKFGDAFLAVFQQLHLLLKSLRVMEFEIDEIADQILSKLH